MKKQKYQIKSLGALFNSDTNSETLLVKQETLIWIATIFSSILVYVFFALVIKSIYKPDLALLKSEGDNLLIASSVVRPEPMESLLFRSGVVSIPLLLLGFYSFYSTKSLIANIAPKPYFNILLISVILAIIALVYYDFASLNPFSSIGGDIPQTMRDRESITNFDFYFWGLFLGNHLFIYTFLIFPITCCLFFICYKKFNLDENRNFNLYISIAGYYIVSIVILACVLMDTFHFPYTAENKYDFSAVYYAMSQVYAGAPLLANHFSDTYGLFPHFLNPLFQLAGLSVYTFSLVMALILGLAFSLNLYCLGKFVRNKTLLFMGMAALIYIPFLNTKFTASFDANFAFFPIRYIVPSVLIFLATVYLKKRSKTVYWFTSFIMAFLVLWNPEFGLLSYFSWLAFNTYIDYYGSDSKPDFKRMLFHWLSGILILVIVFYIFKLIIFLSYSQSPDMARLWDIILIYGNSGFMLLPMSLVHPWNILVLVLIIGFAYSNSIWHKKENNSDPVVFLITLLGTGSLFYFQGRSHNWNLAICSGMGIFLFTILGDRLWTLIKNRNVLSLNVFFALFLYVISFSIVEVVAQSGKLYELVYQEKDKNDDIYEMNLIENCRDFIMNRSHKGEKIYVFTNRKVQDLFFGGSKRLSAFNPGMIDLYLRSDLRRMERQIIDSSFDVFVTPMSFRDIEFMERPLTAIAATYDFKEGNESISFLAKRKNKNPVKVFFGDSMNNIIHRKYNDDTASAQMRINDASGIQPIHMNPEFSVEVLFYSNKQVFSNPTLIGNQREIDSSGFAISNYLNSSKYLFSVGCKGYILTLPETGWIYCVMNGYRDHFEVYINGKLMATYPLSKPITNSPDKLCIGDMGYMHFYVGAISEVSINNKPLDSNQVSLTWEEINSFIAGRTP